MTTTDARTLAIAQIGTLDEGGGAATVAGGLMRGYAARGHRVTHIVGRKCSDDPNVEVLPDDDRLPFRLSGYTAVQRALRRLAGHFPDRGFGLMSRSLRFATHPRALASYLNGVEDFDFPGTDGLLDRLDAVPDILHAHNLHGGFFDLRALAALSHRVPTVLTLHDMWLLTGHCAHSLDCERWQGGCGSCPYLRLDPAVRRDATAENWRRKQSVYAKSHLHVATPSRWLRDKVERSILAPASLRVIPNGVDTSVFRPANRLEVRKTLSLPADTFIVLLTTGSKGSMWKDDAVLRETMERLNERPLNEGTLRRPILFVAVGRESVAAGPKTLSIPFQRDPVMMARYYQAADLYLHAARADTFPLAVLEALACATPVVATAVGGVPEQIITSGDASGVLVPPGDAMAMAAAVEALVADDSTRQRLGANAVTDVNARFTLDRQVESYLHWYEEIVVR